MTAAYRHHLSGPFVLAIRAAVAVCVAVLVCRLDGWVDEAAERRRVRRDAARVEAAAAARQARAARGPRVMRP